MASRHELIGSYQGLKHPSCCWLNEDLTQTIIGRVDVETKSADGSIRVVEHHIKGSIYPNQLVRNITYRFFGFWKEFRGVDQFVFESFVAETPAGEEAVVAYLCQCKGIGPVMARSIFRLYEDEAVQKLREEPEVVAGSVPRFSIEKAREAAAFLKESQTTERSKIDLFGLLKGRGFPKKVIDKVLADFGAESSQVVARNPYILMRYKGCGFLKTDKMYLDLGLPATKMKRQALCAWHSIASQSGGDIWFPFHIVQSGLRKNISSVAIDIERAMALAIRAKMLSEKFHKGQRWVAEYVRDQQEQKIADLLDEARREQEEKVKPVLWAHIADKVKGISNHQREQLKLATYGFVGILSGRPGSGKTYTVARFVQALKEEFGEQHIAIATPTGKASVRATAAMNAVGIPLVASTSHSLLGFSGNGFAFNRERPLQFLFVDIDEDSMTDVVMKKATLEARAEGAHMLFVGDPNQLAPVGHGAPLRDMILAEIPHGELKEIQRNSGRIVKACGEIIDRGRFTTSPKLNVAEGENLLLIERANPESQIDTLAALMVRFQRDFAEGKTDAVDPIWDCQVIVAVNAKSELGRKPLNAKLQDLLNPDGHRVSGNPFRIGDKIINTKNAQYKAVVSESPVPKTILGITIVDQVMGYTLDDLGGELPDNDTPPTTHYVANGEQAEVLDVDTTKIVARLTSPDRVILIPRSAKQISEDGDSPDQGNDSEESTGSGCAWELGYAISGHKSQGSEWPIVIVMVDDYNGAKMVQSKQWLYTAISRAKKTCFLIGQQKTVNQCCQRDALFQRKTFLRERILELKKPVITPISDEALELLLEMA